MLSPDNPHRGCQQRVKSTRTLFRMSRILASQSGGGNCWLENYQVSQSEWHKFFTQLARVSYC
jgi:hypothetical protein